VNVTGSQPYADNSSEFYTNLVVNIVGDLNSTYIKPTGLVEYEIGSTIRFEGNLSDDCGSQISGANVIFRLNGSSLYTCGPVTNATGNLYTCDFDTTAKTGGNYNVTMVAYKNYYNNGTDSEDNAFRIKATPRLTAANVTPKTEGWSVRRNFTVNVTDNAGDTVTVSLWEAPVSTEDWSQIGVSQQCTSCSKHNLMVE